MADDDAAPAGGTPQVRRSSRDPDRLRARLEAWLARTLTPGAEPRITDLAPTASNGMSSETLLVDASWRDDGVTSTHRLVARLAPDRRDVPVFPRYDLGRQSAALRLVAELTDVPVPRVRFSEPDPAAVGAPFFIMDRVEGRVPPDVMPYNFGDNWLHEASPAEQRHLQDATVDVLARLHACERATEHFAFLAADAPGDTPLRRRVALTHDWYAFAAADGFRSPLVERACAWLDDHWPRHEPDPVLCWGDARIGNILYDGFDPAAVLDWEMATLGPPELDVAWLVYGHRIFEDLAASLGLPGLPDLLRADDVAATYTSLAGHEPRALDWYGTYAAVQYAIVFLRTGARAVHFGEAAPPEHPDDVIINREPLERMLAGRYWS